MTQRALLLMSQHNRQQIELALLELSHHKVWTIETSQTGFHVMLPSDTA